MNKLTQKLAIKAALSGAVLATAGTLMYGSAPVQFASYSVTPIIPLFIAGATSSVITDYAADQKIFGKTQIGMKAADLTGMAANAAIAAGATVGIMALTGLPSTRWIAAGALGAGSEIISDYAYNNILTGKNGQLLIGY